jgi:hypothetical protein
MSATIENIYSMLATNKHEILHLSCHCIGNNLLLEDEHGACHLVDGQTFAKILRDRGRHVRLVVLTSCSSEKIAKLLVGPKRSAIGTKGAVADATASYFSQHLYMSMAASNCNSGRDTKLNRGGGVGDYHGTSFSSSKLGSCDLNALSLPPSQHCINEVSSISSSSITLSQAFDMSIDAIRASPQFTNDEANQFVLYPASIGLSINDPILFAGGRRRTSSSSFSSSNSNSNGAVLFGSSGGRYTNDNNSCRQRQRSPSLTSINSLIPALTEDFVGREVDIYRILRVLSKRRVVFLSPTASTVLKGNVNGGMGTSSLSVAVAHHLQRRRYGWSNNWCKDGVFYLRGCESVNDIVEQWNVQLKRHDSIENGGRSSSSNCDQPPDVAKMNRRDQYFSSSFYKAFVKNLRQSQKCLMILDQFNFDEKETIGPLCYFFNLLICSVPQLKIMVTTSNYNQAMSLIEGEGDGCTSRVYKPCMVTISGLSNFSSALLLIKRAHRSISMVEIIGENHLNKKYGVDNNNNQNCAGSKQEENENKKELETIMRGNEKNVALSSSNSTLTTLFHKEHHPLVRALSKHALIKHLKGCPWMITRAAVQINDQLRHLNELLPQIKINSNAK